MSVLRTPLCELLEIDVPIIQAAMGGVAGPALAAAVSNAGGLGQITQLIPLEPSAVRDNIKQVQDLTDRNFAVNMILNERFGREKDLELRTERINLLMEEGVKFITFFWGDPSPYVNLIHSAGALILHQVGSAKEAREVVAAGADIVIAQGMDAGGHVIGQVGTLSLVPRVVDAVAPIPVVAAGGIADGRGVAAALALGAQAVYIGTRFIVSEESLAHPQYIEKILKADESDAVYLKNLFDVGWPDAPHRVIRNSTVSNWEAAGEPESGQRPGQGDEIGVTPGGDPIVRYRAMTANSSTPGDIEAMPLWAGQGVGFASQIQPVNEIVRELVEGAKSALDRCSSFV